MVVSLKETWSLGEKKTVLDLLEVSPLGKVRVTTSLQTIFSAVFALANYWSKTTSKPQEPWGKTDLWKHTVSWKIQFEK